MNRFELELKTQSGCERTSIFVGVLTVITVLACVLLSSYCTFAANTGNLDTKVSVTAACSLAVDDTSHSVSVIPGNNVLLGTSTVTAFCNDPAGLAVYMVGYTGNEYGNTKLTATINETTEHILTGNAGSPTSSQWNMTLTAVNGTYTPQITSGYTSAQPIPSQYTKVAYRTAMTGVGASTAGANFTAAFNAYVTTSQPAGVYTGKVKVLLVHPNNHAAPATPAATPHQICYFGNEEDEGSMACQTTVDGGSSTAIAVGSSVTLRAPNFSKAGYGFAGWNTKEDGSGTNYGPMESVTITQDMYDNGLVLFANWVQSTGTLQSFSCSNLASGAVTALTDTRDNDTYAVAKLADGKCWMIENLRLDYDATISTSNTQSNNNAFGGVFAGLAEPESANFSDSTTANSLYTTDTSSTDLRIITGSYQAYRFPRYNNGNTASRTANNTTSNTNVYGYGNYYTWAAAVADTTNYSTNNQSVTDTSLCPTGWHLPKGGDRSNEVNNEWWNLTVTGIMNGANPANYDSSSQPYYTGTPEGSDASEALRAYPTNLVYSGVYSSSSASGRGTYGIYWSSTVNGGSYYAYYEGLASSNVDPGTVSYSRRKYGGLTVRCLAD